MEITLSSDLFLAGIPENLKNLLIEQLTIANPKWQENARMKRWNRGIPQTLRYYTRTAGDGLRIPRGYIRHLIDLCRREHIPYQIIDKRRTMPSVDFTFTGRLKPFQQEAVHAMLQKEFGVLCAPTGAGKTVMALQMINVRKQPALIIVHTKDLAFQWIDRIQNFMHLESEEIGLIGAGQKKIGAKITVALVQSLYRIADEAAERIGFLIVDESHRCPSRTFTEAVTAFNARYMLGLSATPWRRDNLSKLIFWHLGDLHFSVDKQHLIESGHMLEAKVIIRETEFHTHFDPVNEYSQMLSELTSDTQRNQLIAEDIYKEAQISKGVCLVLSDRKAHCKNIQTLLRFRYKLPSDLLTGDVPAADRQAIVEKLQMGQIKVLIATGQLIGEGFDCPNLTSIFLLTPIRFSGRVLQYIGRVLRPADGKTTAKIFDYVDIHVDVLVAAANARRRVYSS